MADMKPRQKSGIIRTWVEFTDNIDPVQERAKTGRVTVQEVAKFLQERSAVEHKYANLLSGIGKPGTFGGKRLDGALLNEQSTLRSALVKLIDSLEKEVELHRKIGDHIASLAKELLDFDQRLAEHKRSWSDFHTEELRAKASYKASVDAEAKRLDTYETEVKRLIGREQYAKADEKKVTVLQSQENLQSLIRGQKDQDARFKTNMKRLLTDVENMEVNRIETIKHYSTEYFEAQISAGQMQEQALRQLEKAFALVNPALEIMEFIETYSDLSPDQQLQVAEPQRSLVAVSNENIYFPDIFAARLGFSPSIDRRAWDRAFYGTWLLSQSDDIDLVMASHLATVLDLHPHEAQTYLQVFQPYSTSSIETRLLALLQLEGVDNPIKQQIIKDELFLVWLTMSWAFEEKALIQLDLPECFHKSKVTLSDIGFALQSLDSKYKAGQRAPSVWNWPTVQWLSKGLYSALVCQTRGQGVLTEAWRQYVDSLSSLWPNSWISLWLVLAFHVSKLTFKDTFELEGAIVDLHKVLGYCLSKNEGNTTLGISGEDRSVSVTYWTRNMAVEAAPFVKQALRTQYQKMPESFVLEAACSLYETVFGLAQLKIDWKEELSLYGLAMATQIKLNSSARFEESLSHLSEEINRLLVNYADCQGVWVKRIESPQKYCMQGLEEGIKTLTSQVLEAKLQKSQNGTYCLNAESKEVVRNLLNFDTRNATKLADIMKASVDSWVDYMADSTSFDISGSVAAETWESLSSALPHSQSARNIGMKMLTLIGKCQSEIGHEVTSVWEGSVSSQLVYVFSSYCQEMARSILSVANFEIESLPSYNDVLWSRKKPAEVLWNFASGTNLSASLDLSKALLRLNNVDYLAHETIRLLTMLKSTRQDQIQSVQIENIELLQDLLARKTVIYDLIPHLLVQSYEKEQLTPNLNNIVRVFMILGKNLSSQHFVSILALIEKHFTDCWIRRLILASASFTPSLAKSCRTDLQHLSELFEAKQETGEIKGLPLESQTNFRSVQDLIHLLTLPVEGLKELYAQESGRNMVGWLLCVKGEGAYLRSRSQ